MLVACFFTSHHQTERWHFFGEERWRIDVIAMKAQRFVRSSMHHPSSKKDQGPFIWLDIMRGPQANGFLTHILI